MKKSELKNYIKENIISTLSEDTDEEIAKTKELTAAVKDLDVAKKEAGIEEANVGLADLQDIGYDDGEYAFDMHFNKSQLNNRLDTKYYTRGFVQAITDSAESLRLNENATPIRLNEAKFKVGDKVTMKGGGDEMEVMDSRRMFDSKINAYIVKKSDGKTVEYDESQLKLKENAIPLMKDFTYDYEDIGQFYLEGFGKEHTLNNDQLGKLGKMITNRFYGGDIKKAYDDVYKTSQNSAVNRLASKGQLINPMTIDEEEIPTATMSKINSTVTTIPSAAKQMLDFFNQMAEKESLDFMKNSKFKIAINSLKSLAGDKEETPVTEDEDKEPTKSDIKKTKGLAKAKEELALLTREMKSLAKKYSKAEGADKEKLVKTLKAKTKLKKELENILDNKKI